MKRLPAVLVFLLLFLSFFAGTASAFMGGTLEKRVGDFFSPTSDCVGFDSPGAHSQCRENWCHVYDVAPDVRKGPNVYTYVVQNPWTAYDPLGLYSWKEYKQDFSAGLSSIGEFVSPTVETGGAMLNLANDYTGALMNSLSGGLVFDSHAASFEQSAKDIVVGTANQVSQLSTDAQGALEGLGQGDLSGFSTMVNNFVGYEEGDSGERTAGKFFTAGLPFGKIKGLNVPEVSKKIPAEKLKYKPKNRGNAPIGDDGKPVELHHNDQSLGNQSSRSEMTRTDHRGPGNFKKNHPNTGQKPSTVDRAESSKQHRKHWEQEFDSGRFDDLPEQ